MVFIWLLVTFATFNYLAQRAKEFSLYYLLEVICKPRLTCAIHCKIRHGPLENRS